MHTEKKKFLAERIDEAKKAYSIPLFTDPIGKILTNIKHDHQSIAVDLGMNVGSFPLVFSSNFDQIYCLEASKANCTDARENLAGYDNIQIMHAALHSISNEKIALQKVSINGSCESGNFTTTDWDKKELNRSSFPGSFEGIEEIVSTISFSDFLKEMNVKSNINFLKVDVEGAEYAGLINEDLSNIDFAVLEIHYTALGKERTKELIQHLLKYFDFYDPRDRPFFLEKWPTPDLLRLVKKDSSQFKTLLSRYLLVILKVQRRLLKAAHSIFVGK
ncbi:MAG: FkbM family methyltransferase [Rhodobacteraceae bacterium]|nr:FkbM family methyltransferase [Paracoccaceae bacterium]